MQKQLSVPSYGGNTRPIGAVHMHVIPRNPHTAVPGKELTFKEILEYGFPHGSLHPEVAAWRRGNLKNLWRGLYRVLTARCVNISHIYGQLSLVVVRRNGEWLDYGLASMRVVTTTGVNYIVDAFQNTTEVENLKFHGFGTGTNAEAVGDTTLQTELTTQYNPDSTRPTGSTTEGASANIYRTVGTLSPDAGGTIAITEHGIFSATSAGTLLDRSVFSAVNIVASADSLQATYDLTVSSGG